MSGSSDRSRRQTLYNALRMILCGSSDILTADDLEGRSALLKEAATIETNMQKVDTVKEQIKALREAIKALTDSMDWVTRDIYSIDR